MLLSALREDRLVPPRHRQRLHERIATGAISVVWLAEAIERDIELPDLGGGLFTPRRIAPHGSNWPSNIEGDRGGPPRPATISIRRVRRADDDLDDCEPGADRHEG